MTLRGASIWVFLGFAALAAVVGVGAGFAFEDFVSTPLVLWGPAPPPTPPTPDKLLHIARVGDRAVVAMFGLCLGFLVAVTSIGSLFYLGWRANKNPHVVDEPLDWTGIVLRHTLAFALCEGVVLAAWCAYRRHLPALPGGIAIWSASVGLAAATGLLLLRYGARARWLALAFMLPFIGMGVVLAHAERALVLRPTPWLAFAAACLLVWRPPATNRSPT